MAQKLFPILADPNAPSLFDGLDVSLSAGQITALNGSKSLTMTATNGLFQTAAAKNSNVSSEELQFNNDLTGTYSSLSSSQMFINSPNSDVNHLTGSLVELSDENSADQNRTTIQKDKVQVVNTAGGNKTAYMDAENVNMTKGADTVNMTASTLTANGVSASWVDIVDAVVNPPATPTLQSVLESGNTAIAQSIVLEDADPATASSSLSSTTFLMTGATVTDKSTINVSSFKIEDATKSVILDNVQNNDYDTGLQFHNTATGIHTNYQDNLIQIQSYISGTPGDATSYHTTELNGIGLYLNPPTGPKYNPNFSDSRYTYAGLTSHNATNTVVCKAQNGFSDVGAGALAGKSSSLNHATLTIQDNTTGQLNSQSVSRVYLQNTVSSSTAKMEPASLILASATTSLTLSPTISTSAGGSTDQYLVVTINGTAYRISLLAPPAP